jgi:hypothetical protein
VDGLPVFDLPKSEQPITSEQVKALESDGEGGQSPTRGR